MKKFALIGIQLLSQLQICPLKGNSYHGHYHQDSLVIAFVVVALLLLLFGRGMMIMTMMSGGMMGSGSMGGINWLWLPTLLVVVLGIVLFSVIFEKKLSSRIAGNRGNVGHRGRHANPDDRLPRVPIRRGFDLNQIIGTDQGVIYPMCCQSTRSCLLITARLGNQ